MITTEGDLPLSRLSPTYPVARPSDKKIATLAQKIFSSKALRLLATVVLSATFRPIFITRCPTAYYVTVLALAALEVYHSKDQLVYEVPLAYATLREKFDSSWKWYHQIIPPTEGRGAVFLGALPLKNLGHHETFKDFAILSLVQDPELTTLTPWSDPVTPEDWDKLGTRHKQIPTRDLQPVPVEKLWEAVPFIEEQTSLGKSVYVHCKAGRTRSATAVISFLLYRWKIEGKLSKDLKIDTANAIAFVKKIRPRIFLLSGDISSIEGFHHSLA